MSYACIYGGKECDGCMKCYDDDHAKIHCSVCESGIYEGDLYFEINGEIYCEDCARDEFGCYA